MNFQPSLFLSHGSPLLALEGGGWGATLQALGGELHPKAILVVSAHWEADGPPRITSATHPGLLYDFSGFPEALYSMEYPALGHPDWARRIESRLAEEGLASVLDDHRPLDHGAWAPLLHLFPDAAFPVLQLSLPLDRTPEHLYHLGQALAPLRREGLLILGSGGMVHNLRNLEWQSQEAPESWASTYDAWAARCLETRDLPALLNWRTQGPEALKAHPTPEHWDPILVALGAAGEAPCRTLFEGYEHRNLSLRSVIWD